MLSWCVSRSSFWCWEQMTSSHFHQGKQTVPPLSSVNDISTELPWQDTVIRVQHFEAEKRIVVFCETLAECFSNAHPGYAKNWLKPRSFSYFLKDPLKGYNYPKLHYLCTTLTFPFFHYLSLIITTTAYAQYLIAVASGNRAWLLIPLCLGKKGAEYCAWTERHLYSYLQKG